MLRRLRQAIKARGKPISHLIAHHLNRRPAILRSLRRQADEVALETDGSDYRRSDAGEKENKNKRPSSKKAVHPCPTSPPQ
jgi:IS30 family transposase